MYLYLSDNITKFTGRAKKPNEHAHYILAGGATRKSAIDAQNKIKQFGVDVNEGANGVFMPANSKYVKGTIPAHSKIHTDKYYDAVWDRIKGVQDASELRSKLEAIRNEIIAGTFPY